MASETGTRLERNQGLAYSRTIAEIEWLLLILSLLFLATGLPVGDDDTAVALSVGVFFFAAFVLAVHYTRLQGYANRWMMAFEVLAMLLYVTWDVSFTGKLDSPLVHLYYLPIIVSALTLGNAATYLNLALIALATFFMQLSIPVAAWSQLLTDMAMVLGPMIMVAYTLTMLTSDTEFGFNWIQYLAETDPVTGLFNLRGYQSALEAIASQSRRDKQKFSVLMIEADNLGPVNDTVGHDAGDALLKHAANCIKANVKKTDIVARSGGDEFAVLLRGAGRQEARKVAERIRRSIESASFEFSRRRLATTVSVGISTFPDDGPDTDTIRRTAGAAMYASKNAGRNRVSSGLA